MTGEFAVAVHAIVFLNHKHRVMSSEAVAENVCTNPARVRKILAKLKKAGLLETREGMDGGYFFCLDPARMNLCRIADALEADFVSVSWKSGDSNMECLIASGMAGVMDELYGELNQRCREYLKSVTVADLDQQIFGRARQKQAT